MSWKDRSHPLAGGAEKVSGEIMDRLARDGHSVRLITSKYPGSKVYEAIRPNFEIYRSGSRYTVYTRAKDQYKKAGKDWADVVIDEMNTIPFWAARYTKKTTNILLSYQLAREVWFYQMTFPFSLLGYLSEPIMLRLLSRCSYAAIATESHSSKSDLERYGFKNVRLFRVGIDFAPLKTLPKKTSSTLVSLGQLRPMKRTIDIVKAFEVAHALNSDLHLIIAGSHDSTYGKMVKDYIARSPHVDAIELRGRVPLRDLGPLLRQSALILVTSVKEGWGLIVTEANSQGTPAIVYDVDGLRDSVKADRTGIVVANNDYDAMGRRAVELLSNHMYYNEMRHRAWKLSMQYTYENSYNDFLDIIASAKASAK